jgi:UDP-N-acetylglucosamine 1-carboxyvinyltransferase
MHHGRIYPDLLSIVLVVATQAKGSVDSPKMFESRLFFVD